MSDLSRFPCGCVVGTVEEAFVMIPCSVECEYFQYAMGRAAELGKPISVVVDPEVAG